MFSRHVAGPSPLHHLPYLVPSVWFEQTTYRLQGGCTTTVLQGLQLPRNPRQINLAVHLGIEPSSFPINSRALTPCVLVYKKLWGGVLVGMIGFEPIQPEVTDLQSAAPLQLRRIPVAGMDQYRQLLDDVDVDDELLVASNAIPFVFPTTDCLLIFKRSLLPALTFKCCIVFFTFFGRQIQLVGLSRCRNVTPFVAKRNIV